MNNFIFYSPTEFVFGRDTEAQTGVLVQKYLSLIHISEPTRP